MKTSIRTLALLLTALLSVLNLGAQYADDPAYMQELATPVPASAKTMACATTNDLTTFYTDNNGQAGQMFDIVAINCVTIQCFDVNLYSGTNQYQIYYKTGTFLGFENNSAAWTLVGGPVSVTSAGPGLPSAIPINVNITIPAGQRAAFYITCNRTLTSGGGVRYTNGSTVGAVLASDANIQILEGYGKAWSFGSSFITRQFNGRVFYDVCTVLEQQSIELTTGSGPGLIDLNWITEGSLTDFRIERKEKDGSFGLVGEAEGNHFRIDNPEAGEWELRVSAAGPDGNRIYSNISSVMVRNDWFYRIAGSQILLAQEGRYSITDLSGRLIISGTGQVIDLAQLEQGIYLLGFEGRFVKIVW